MKVTLERTDDAFQFTAKDANGKTVVFDAGPKTGGKSDGVSPMQTLLMAAGGCSAIDVILILRKQKQEITAFHIEIDGERVPNQEPSLWQDVHLLFKLDGTIDGEKAKRAVQLSMEKYCSVVKTLEGAGAKITWEVQLNGNTV